MNSRLLLPLLFFPSLIPCEGQEAPRVRRVMNPEARIRQEMSPTKSAEEWIARLEEDDVRSRSSTFQYLYPELPPQKEWQKIIPPLENDQRKAPQNGMRFGQKFEPEKKLLFVALLEADEVTAQRVSREILMRVKDSEFRREERLRIILSLSSDPLEGLKWLKENRPEFLIPRDPPNYTKPEKEALGRRLSRRSGPRRNHAPLGTRQRKDRMERPHLRSQSVDQVGQNPS